jgi:hypothetical protein
MPYTPTTWNPGAAPGISAAELNRIEAGVDDAVAGIEGHAGAGGAVHADVVAGGADGFMTGADKTKLDGIESGATADQTANEILTALLGVDGSGSLLDADKLDGYDHRGVGGTSEHPAATTDTAGFLSSTDKTKLDGIASGAIATEAGLLTFSKVGTLAVATGAHRLYVPWAITIVSVGISLGTANTGATFIVDVNKNGTTIYGTQADRPDIAASGQWSGWHVPNTTAVAADDYLTVDVDQVGSTIAGADLTVIIRYTKP